MGPSPCTMMIFLEASDLYLKTNFSYFDFEKLKVFVFKSSLSKKKLF